MEHCHKESERCPHAEDAADAAVKKVFGILGVDVNNPQSVEEFRQDLRFGARLRRISDRVSIAIILLVVSAIVSGVLSVLWDHVKE